MNEARADRIFVGRVVFFLVAAGCLFAWWDPTVQSQRPQLPPITEPDPLNREFEFGLFQPSMDSKEQGTAWLVLRYDDGRTFAVKAASVTSVRYAPKAIANTMGLKWPYIEIDHGPKTRRIDIIDDETAEFFRDQILAIGKLERMEPPE